MWQRAREIIGRLRGQPVREHDVIGASQEGEMEANELEVPVETAAADASPVVTTSPDPAGAELYRRQQASEAKLRRVERDLHAAEEEEAVLVAAEVTDIETHVANLGAIDTRIATLKGERRAHEHRVVLLGDKLLPHRQAARGRAQERLRSEIEEIEAADLELKAKIAEHLNAAQQFERERQALEHRARPLVQEIERLSLRTDRLVRVNVRLAASWQPPAGMLIKPSAWRAFVEAARAAQLETAEIVVDEMSGMIVRSPLRDVEPRT